MMDWPDVVIIGGGGIGCACAWELAGRGLRVVVVERGTPGREATWAAAGMLSALSDGDHPADLLLLARASRDRYPSFVEALRQATGVELAYRTPGSLRVALSDGDAASLQRWVAHQREAGFEAEWLDADAVRRLEPSLAAAVRGGALARAEQHIDNRRLGRALWAAATAAGARFRLGVPATRILGADTGRVTGVELATGERIEAGAVVLAAGCWSGLLSGLPRALPVAPVRGQMLALEAVPPPIGRIVMTTRCYLIPDAGGRVLVGATVEQAGFHAVVTPAGLRHLADAACAAAPVLADAPVAEVWAGLRPGTPDGLPVLGPDPEVPNLVYATGHHRNGILLVPITARVVGDVVLGTTPAVPLEPFSPARFKERDHG
ncbi:MAG TPA: glycine oxidase ThiO [Longimicrobiales bacterium]